MGTVQEISMGYSENVSCSNFGNVGLNEVKGISSGPYTDTYCENPAGGCGI
jgi:hypothetical protein